MVETLGFFKGGEEMKRNHPGYGFLLCLSSASVEKTFEKNVQQPQPVDISLSCYTQLEKAKVMEAENPKELFIFH
jgi:hypothetical protein